MEKYMEELKMQLRGFDEELASEIISDYEQHFIEGRLEGKSDSEIISELGSIDDMIDGLKETHAFNQRKESMNADIKEDNVEALDEEKKMSDNDNLGKIITNSFCKQLILDADIANVEIKANNTDKVEIIYENRGGKSQLKKFKFYSYEKDDILYAGVKKVTRGLDLFGSIIRGDVKIKLMLPKDMKDVTITTKVGDIDCTNAIAERIDMSALSSDISVSNMNANTIVLNTKAGDIELNNVIAKELGIKAASGDVDIENVTISDNTDITLLSGDVSVDNMNNNIIKLNTASGDIDCDNIAYNYGKFDTASGDVRLEIDKHKETVCKSGCGDVYIKLQNSNGITLGVTTGCGDANVYWGKDKQKCLRNGFYTYGLGEEKVTIQTGAGDIKISR